MASSATHAVRCTFGVVVTLGGMLASAASAQAQEFPTRTIRMVLPFPAGGGSDLVARIIAQKYSTQLGQQVVVDNRAGASGNMPAEFSVFYKAEAAKWADVAKQSGTKVD